MAQKLFCILRTVALKRLVDNPRDNAGVQTRCGCGLDDCVFQRVTRPAKTFVHCDCLSGNARQHLFVTLLQLSLILCRSSSSRLIRSFAQGVSNVEFLLESVEPHAAQTSNTSSSHCGVTRIAVLLGRENCAQFFRHNASARHCERAIVFVKGNPRIVARISRWRVTESDAICGKRRVAIQRIDNNAVAAIECSQTVTYVRETRVNFRNVEIRSCVHRGVVQRIKVIFVAKLIAAVFAHRVAIFVTCDRERHVIFVVVVIATNIRRAGKQLIHCFETGRDRTVGFVTSVGFFVVFATSTIAAIIFGKRQRINIGSHRQFVVFVGTTACQRKLVQINHGRATAVSAHHAVERGKLVFVGIPHKIRHAS